jgi:hypothetical protein
VDVNRTTSADFVNDVLKPESITALTYRLQRKNHNSNNQSDVDNTKDISTDIQLVIIFGSDERHYFCAKTILIKCNDTIAWDKNKLEELYYRHRARYTDNHVIKETWLLDDATVLMTVLKWSAEGRAFEITVFKGTRRDDSIEPLCISSNMQG